MKNLTKYESSSEDNILHYKNSELTKKVKFIPKTVTNDLQLAQEVLLKTKNPYQLLGFGYIALFRTMRFLFFIFLVVSIVMILAGLYNNTSTPVNNVGFRMPEAHSVRAISYS